MLPNLRFIRYNHISKPSFNVSSSDCINRKIHNLGLNDIPKITSTDIKKLLRQKGYAVQDGYTSLMTRCSICFSENKPSDSKVYVNKATGEFLIGSL